MNDPAGDVAARVARTSYGRLVALLAAPTGDLQAAEDTLAHAFERALSTWPATGVPDNPEGWLLTVARNRQRDEWRSARRRRSVPLDDVPETGPGAAPWLDDLDPDAIPDHRLALMFVCAHPAIAAPARTPLMLQVVLGFSSAQVARAFALPTGAMQQRLVRAKGRIREAGIPFSVPDRSAMPERLPWVLEAVYGCYAIAGSGRPDAREPAGEARHLATTLATLLGNEPEAWSLAALLTLAAARDRPATSDFEPLETQDPATWSRELVAEGEAHLRRAERPGRVPGRFQLEAAIHAVHCARVRGAATDWAALSTLYAALVRVAPSLGSRVAQAAVVARTESAEAAMLLLEALPPERERFQPFHATRADVLARCGRTEEAARAARRAAALADDPAVARYLAGRADAWDRAGRS